VLMATTFAAPTSSAIALARYFDAFIDPILIDGADEYVGFLLGPERLARVNPDDPQ
jgi:hypothetical protein